MFALPLEIWESIYVYLERRDIRATLAVCKTWNKISTHFLGTPIYVSARMTEFPQLFNDIHTYPEFAAKIIQLTIQEDDRPERLSYRTAPLRNALVLLLPPSELQVCLEDFNSRNLHLPRIQMIYINFLQFSDSTVHRLNTKVQYNLRATITVLQLSSLVGTAEYGGLANYISQFPHLESVIIESNDHPINLQTVLGANSNIERLDFQRTRIITAEYRSEVDFALKYLLVSECRVDISFLNHVMSRFKKLESFSLIDVDVSQDEAVSDDEAEEIIKKFNSFSNKWWHLKYTFKGRVYEIKK